MVSPGTAGICNFSSRGPADVLVDALGTGKGQGYVVLGVHPQVMGRHLALPISHADPWRRSLEGRFGDVEVLVFGLTDAIGPGHVGPHDYELSIVREHLDAAVLSAANVDQPFLLLAVEAGFHRPQDSWCTTFW
jgi:hypothetical protein